jgi:hypothetical protein
MAVSCASPSFCVAIGGTGNALTWNGSSWSAPVHVDPIGNVSSISCPSTTFCLAVDLGAGKTATNGDYLTWDGSSWTTPASMPRAGSVSCTSASFCAAGGDGGSFQTWNGTAWTSLAGDAGEAAGLSCSSPTFCAAVTLKGNAETFNGTSWSASSSVDPGGNGLTSVSCTSSSFCAAADAGGNALTYNGTSWSATGFIGTNGSAVSCSSVSFCLAVNDSFGVTWDGTSWSPADVFGSGTRNLSAVSCVSATFCALVDYSGDVETWNGTSPTYQPTGVGQLNAVSCASTSVCWAAAGNGDAIKWDGTSWTDAGQIDPSGLSSISCPTATFCMAADFGASPTATTGDYVTWDGTTWSTPASMPKTGDIFCTSATFCAAVGSGNQAIWTGSWSAPTAGDGNAVSCSSSTFCVAGGLKGDVQTFDGTTWSAAGNGEPRGSGFTSVSCISSTFCAASDGAGNALTYQGGGATVQGQITAAATSNPLSGAAVQVCVYFWATLECPVVQSDASGNYSIGNLPAGSAVLTVSPPSGSTLLPKSLPETLVAGGVVTANAALFAPQPPPAGTTISGSGTNPTGTTVVYMNTSYPITTQGCPNGSASFTVTAPNSQNGALITVNGSLQENPAGSGTYTGIIPALSPAHGAGDVQITFTCPGPTTPPIDFTIYIDPSGTVVNTQGMAIAGATVTLSRSDSANGPFTPVASGSPIMSPANRLNPDTTNHSGQFGWDVLSGFYRVQASAPGCFAPGANPSQKAVSSPVFQVPPPVTTLRLTLQCPASKGHR